MGKAAIGMGRVSFAVQFQEHVCVPPEQGENENGLIGRVLVILGISTFYMFVLVT